MYMNLSNGLCTYVTVYNNHVVNVRGMEVGINFNGLEQICTICV